jgi:hypothetical protein
MVVLQEVKATREQVLAFVDGHRRANAFIEAERCARLEALTQEEARAQFDALCSMLKPIVDESEREGLEHLRVEFLMERRRRFDKVAGCR